MNSYTSSGFLFNTAALLFFAVQVLFLQGCGKEYDNRRPDARTIAASYPDSFDEAHARHAAGFTLSYREGVKVLEVLNPYQDKTDTLRYLLVPGGKERPDFYPSAQVVPVPINRIVTLSTTHIGFLEILESEHIVSGLAGAQYVNNPQIRDRIRSGEIVSFDSGNLNMEQVIALDPDVVMVSGGQASQFDAYQVLIDSGINVVVNSEWLESHPLARAEWVKAMAALLNKEKQANKYFDSIEKRYEELVSRTSGIGSKPLVINNLPYKGAWFVSGGESYMARFLKDAGADYPWFDEETAGSLKLDFESVYEQGLEAEIWLHPGTATTKEEILQKDRRLADFKAFQDNRIYNNTRRNNETGGNDFWESGVAEPHLILADLIKILHPDLLPDHELYYYERVD